MKITDILNKGEKTVSFEVFPPKTNDAFESVKTATEEIAKLCPAFMSVTYGAGGGTSKYTLDIAKNINDNFGVPSLAHLTCVSSSKETVRERINDIKSSGVENVMALRGDIPESMKNDDRSRWDYNYALELVSELKPFGFCIGGACYPEKHPESANKQEDIKHLKQKVEAGCDFLTTQMFFDNGLYYTFLDDTARAGIYVPVLPGIMPITNAKQIERAISLSGSFVPKKLLDLADKYGTNPDDMKKAGIEFALEQICDLYHNEVNNVHIYTMNKPDVAKTIKNGLEGIIK